MSETKSNLGQFYTTNYDKILQNIDIPLEYRSRTFIEPFAGKGDLINYLVDNVKEKTLVIECFDIEPKVECILKRDTLMDPPDYSDKFIVTNPPYLARNKSKNKEIFDKYDQGDLYKCFIESLLESSPVGGILIIPLNFWCSVRKRDLDLRERFLKRFSVRTLNIFEERVFDDTSYTVCSFLFETVDPENSTTICFRYPSEDTFRYVFSEDNLYSFGGEIHLLKQNRKIKVERATKRNENSPNITNILLKCIDDSPKNLISLSIVEDKDRYIDKTKNLSARSYATLVIEPSIDTEQQKALVDRFNGFMKSMRKRHRSLFLTNYREKDRKRISFKLAFRIVNHLLSSSTE